jgi:hypothetical protein
VKNLKHENGVVHAVRMTVYILMTLKRTVTVIGMLVVVVLIIIIVVMVMLMGLRMC